MTRTGTSKEVGQGYPLNRLRKARAYHEAARLVCEHVDRVGDSDPVASNAALAAIAYGDAITAAYLGLVNQKDHSTAPKLLRDSLGNALPDSQDRLFRKLVGIKDEVQYGAKLGRAVTDPYVKAGKGPSAIKIHGMMSIVIGHAIEMELLPMKPLAGMHSPAEPVARRRFLSREELGAFWRHLHHVIATATPAQVLRARSARWIFAVAQRLGEASHIHVREIDFAQKRWTLPPERTKNKTTHVIPLTDWHIDLLGEPNADGYFFYKPSPYFREYAGIVCNEYCRGNQIDPPFHPHDARRTFTTLLGELKGTSEVPLDTRKRILNHKFNDVTAVHYDIYSYLDEKQHAMEMWRDLVLSL